MQGEELRKQIGATYYIECSSKTQQVFKTWQKVIIKTQNDPQYCVIKGTF